MTRASARASGPTVLAVVLAAMGVAAGCAEDADALDRAATERAVERVIGGRIDPVVDRVRCPAEIERGEGERVTCRALLADGGQEVRLRVSQVDEDGRLDVALLDAVLDPADVATDLRRTLVSSFRREFEVDCGDGGPLVAAPDDTFTCTARDPDGEREVTVTVTDAAGTLAYDVGER